MSGCTISFGAFGACSNIGVLSNIKELTMKWHLGFYILAVLCAVVSLVTADVELLAVGLLMSIMGILTERLR